MERIWSLSLGVLNSWAQTDPLVVTSTCLSTHSSWDYRPSVSSLELYSQSQEILYIHCTQAIATLYSTDTLKIICILFELAASW